MSYTDDRELKQRLEKQSIVFSDAVIALMHETPLPIDFIMANMTDLTAELWAANSKLDPETIGKQFGELVALARAGLTGPKKGAS